mmetsp:Transcript_7579/g.16283  ORF Transcript_7579/g.16283 Transcript_7579/m.16283 type:complete len:327 (+) Transcript_7579:776-1756(+)
MDEVGQVCVQRKAFHTVPDERVHDGEGRVHHNQTAVHGVKLISAGDASWVRRQRHLVYHAPRPRQDEVVELEDSKHVRVVVPRAVPSKHVRIGRGHPNKRGASPLVLDDFFPSCIRQVRRNLSTTKFPLPSRSGVHPSLARLVLDNRAVLPKQNVFRDVGMHRLHLNSRDKCWIHSSGNCPVLDGLGSVCIHQVLQLPVGIHDHHVQHCEGVDSKMLGRKIVTVLHPPKLEIVQPHVLIVGLLRRLRHDVRNKIHLALHDFNCSLELLLDCHQRMLRPLPHHQHLVLVVVKLGDTNARQNPLNVSSRIDLHFIRDHRVRIGGNREL